MFIVNNEILSKKETPELWDWYNKKINQIKKSEKKRFIFSSFKFHRYEKDEYGKKIRVPRFKTIPSSSTIENKEMGGEVQTWSYVPSANAIKVDNGIITRLNAKAFKIGQTEVFDAQKDSEIIFFLKHISESLVNGRITEVDYEKDAIDKAESAAVAAEAQYLIFSPHSPINEKIMGSDEVFRQLGIGYSISGAETMHIAELKNKLWGMLSALNKNKKSRKLSYDQFITDCYNSTDVEYKSIVLLAVNRGVVYFDKGGWWLKVKGEYDEQIVKVPTNEAENKKDILVNYLMQHREYMLIIRESIESSAKRIAPIVATGEAKVSTVQEKKWDRKEMMAELMEWGWTFKELMKKKNPELIDLLKNKRKPGRVST